MPFHKFWAWAGDLGTDAEMGTTSSKNSVISDDTIEHWIIRTHWILICILGWHFVCIWAYFCCTVSSIQCWWRWQSLIHWKQKQIEAFRAWSAPVSHPPSHFPGSLTLTHSPEDLCYLVNFNCWLLETHLYDIVTFKGYLKVVQQNSSGIGDKCSHKCQWYLRKS